MDGSLAVHSYTYEAGAEKPITAAPAFSLKPHKEGSSCRVARFTLDGASVASGGEDGLLAVHNLSTHKQVGRPGFCHFGCTQAMHLHRVIARQQPKTVCGCKFAGTCSRPGAHEM